MNSKHDGKIEIESIRQRIEFKIGPAVKIMAALHVLGYILCRFAPSFTAKFIMQRNSAIIDELHIWTLVTGVLPPPSGMALVSALTLAFFIIRLLENTLCPTRLWTILTGASLAGTLLLWLTAPGDPNPWPLFTLPGIAALGALLHLRRGQRVMLFFVELNTRTAVIVLATLILLPWLMNWNYPVLLANIGAFSVGYLLIRQWEKIDKNRHDRTGGNSGTKFRHIELD